MEAQRPPLILRLLPSFTDFAFLMPILFLFARMDGLVTLFGDCDTGFHIRTGEWIAANRAVPLHDLFSYSKSGQPWFAWEWLADILFAWLNSHGGLRTVALFSIVLVSVTFTLLFRLVRGKANPIVAILVTMLAAAASSIHWLARPHLFTLLFVVLFYAALERVREGRTRVAGIPYLAILPVATILWTNLHGGFFVGIVLIGAYGVGEILKSVFSAESGERKAGRPAARRYFLSAAACLAASLVNPYFYHLHVHIAKYVRDPFNSQHIIEFLSPNFHHPAAIFFEAMLALSVAAACWSIAKGRYAEPVYLLVWAHAGLLAARNIPIFMIVAAPPVAACLQELVERVPEWNVAGWLRRAVEKFKRIGADTAETEGVARLHLASAAGLALVAAVIWAPNPPKKFRAEFDPDRYPAAALKVLRQDPAAHVFTDDEWGDYLIWRLYPSQKVFVDGRSDFYGDDFEQKVCDVLNVKYGWDKVLGRFDVDTILLPTAAPLAGALKESSRWKVVYDDGIALVFRTGSALGRPVSVAALGGGASRDREITKTEASDQAITVTKPKT